MSNTLPARPTVTAAVVALNEARHMPQWLAATAWADEQLVVDGGSHDGTLEIARRTTAECRLRRFDNFANQRNYAISCARGDWIFFIDADERSTQALVREVRARIERAREDAFHVPIRSRIFGRRFRYSGTQNDRPLRLIRRGKGHWEGAVHEVYRCRGPRGVLHGWLDHETMPNRTEFTAKVERYTSLEAAARVAAGCAPCWRQSWFAPPREVFRRLLWKHGWLDGPEGWAFCLLSGWSEWVLAKKHRRLWNEAQTSNIPAMAPSLATH